LRLLIPHADVVIPVKKLTQSKTRLSDTLSLEQREELVLVMLEDVLASLHKSNLIDQIVVVTPDRIVADHATDFDAKTIIDSDSYDINESLAKVRTRSSLPLLVLPVDVPLIKADTIDTIIRKVENPCDATVVVSPSKTNGTNALLRNPPDIIPTRFGANSFDAHANEAKLRGTRLVVYRSEDLEIDVDTPLDLHEVIKKGDSTRTSRFLRTILRTTSN